MREALTSIANIRINGRGEALSVSTIAELLVEKGIDVQGRGIAVALNGAVVPRAEWPQTPLRAGDAVEIVQAKQGG
jgi:sulfur carrier protein